MIIKTSSLLIVLAVFLFTSETQADGNNNVAKILPTSAYLDDASGLYSVTVVSIGPSGTVLCN